MIYIVLNVILCAVLVWFSSFEDVRNDDERIKPVINFVLLLSAIAFFTAADIVVSLIGNKQLISVIGKVTLAFFAWFSISISFYLLSFPKIRKGVVTKVICKRGSPILAIFFSSAGLHPAGHQISGFLTVSVVSMIFSPGTS